MANTVKRGGSSSGSARRKPVMAPKQKSPVVKPKAAGQSYGRSGMKK